MKMTEGTFWKQAVLVIVYGCVISALSAMVIAIFLLMMASTPVSAADTADITFQGTVAETKAISANNANTSLALGTGGQAKIFDFTVDSNSSGGFTIQLSSANQGELRSGAYSAGKGGTFIAYTVSCVPQVVGGPTTVSTLTALALITPKSLVYTQDVPTVAKVWDVNITTMAKALLQGTFADTITLTLSNN
jgi:hypothetical protein